MRTKLISISIVVLGAGLIVILLSLLDQQNKLDLVNTISIVGSIASVVGIIIAYLQIISVRKISFLTNNAINLALSEFMKSFSIADISKAAKLSQEIQNLLRSEKPEAALLRLQDLKFIFIQIKHVDFLVGKYDLDEFNKISVDLNVDLNNINSLLLKKKPTLNFLTICTNLETMSTFLNELENKIKYNSHG